MTTVLQQLRGTVAEVIDGHLRDVIKDTDEAATALVERMQAIEQLMVQALHDAQSAEESANQHTVVSDGASELEDFRHHVDHRFEQIHQQQESVIGLSESIKQLTRASVQVRSMAEQTRMLSINAQIEAVHAGLAGQGFSVVAKEVRDLAGASQDVASTIESGVGAMGSRIREAFDTGPEELQHERALLLGVVERMTEALDAQGTFQRQQQQTIADLRRTNQRLTRMIVETMALAQFQDVVRQKLEGVRRLVEALRSDGLSPEQLSSICETYTMASQRQAHAQALGDQDREDEGMEIELF